MGSSTDSIRLNQIIDSGLNIYGSREKIRSNLVSYAKKYLNISNDSDIDKASYLAYLIDMLSILTSNQIYYQSKLYNEFFIVSAKMNESVQNLAKWIGYTIPKATCASTSLMFTIPLTFSASYVNFNFSKYFKAYAGDIPFTIKNNESSANDSTGVSATLNIDTEKLKYATKGEILDNSSVTIRDCDGFPRPVYYGTDGDNKYCSFTLEFEQCEYKILTFNIPSDLQLNQFYQHTLEYDGQVADLKVYLCEPTIGQYLIITGKGDSSDTQNLEEIEDVEKFDPTKTVIDSAGQVCSFKLWTECINGIYTISSTSQQYDWIGYYNKGIISFGNGILGKQPTAGSLVVCVLKLTKGSDGNVINNTITTGDTLEVVIDSSGNTSNVNYELTNNNAAYGGIDILSTSELKNNAIVNLKTRKRLVTDDDYENLTDVVTDTTLTDCIPILKRSDIKVNDISLYFILNYYLNGVNEICPTRNVTIDFREDEIDWDDNNQLTLMKNYEVSVGLDKVPFVTMFNCIMNLNTRVAFYEYTASNIQGVTTELYTNSVSDTMNQNCYIDCKQSDFSIDYSKTVSVNTDKYPVTVKLIVNNIPNKVESEKSSIDYKWTVEDIFREGYDSNGQKKINQFELVHFKSMMVTKWDDNQSYDENSDGYLEDYTIEETSQKVDGITKNYTTKKYNSFSFVIPNYTDIPQGKQRYEFYILGYTPKTDSEGNTYAISCKTGKEIIGVDKDGNRGPEANAIDEIVMEWKIVKKYYSDVIVTQDLSSCMMSSITVDHYKKGIPQIKSESIDPETGETVYEYYKVYHLHECPTIQKAYYLDVMSKENSDFELTVIQKLLENINLSNKRMMSDFTNIKFADTNGPLTNLRYNEESYKVESRYIHTPWWTKQEEGGTSQKSLEDSGIIFNPEYEEPSDTESFVYYVINGKVDQFAGQPTTDYMGYIAIRILTGNTLSPYSYSYVKPELGMIIKIKDELDTEGYMETCVWNGRQWMSVEKYNIPLQLDIKVEVDEDKVSKSDDAIKQEIIETLSEYYNDSTKMGLQKSLDISEIIRVCRAVDGVEYVEVQNPEFDIKFNYNTNSSVFNEMNDLTQEELLNFTPQYVGFRTVTDTNTNYEDTTITVDVVRK